MPPYVLDYFPALKPCSSARAACCPAASNSSSRSRGPSRRNRSCCCSTSPPKGCSPRSWRRSTTSSSGSSLEQNCAVLLVEQNLDFVRDITRSFAILDTGRIVAQGEIDELTDEVVRKHVQV